MSYKDLLNIYWKNIDPFDASGQFCDKGKSYRSVIFENSQKELIDQSFKEIEKFDKKIVTLVWKFDVFTLLKIITKIIMKKILFVI